MTVQFVHLTEPTQAVVDCINRWENDPALVHFIRPNQSQAELERQTMITLEDLRQRLEHHHSYLIYWNNQLVGEMNYMVDPHHLYKKEMGTAWIGITIGEAAVHGKGIGHAAMQFLEEEIKNQGLKRIELGVFEFNTRAHHLYQKLGFQEIARIKGFTHWDGKMWADIRMEKYIELTKA